MEDPRTDNLESTDAAEPKATDEALAHGESAAQKADAKEAPADDAPADATEPLDAQPTARRAPVDATAPRPATLNVSAGNEGTAPRFHDVTGTFGDYVRGRRDAIRGFFATHRLATALLALLAVAMVACLALAFAHASGVPDNAIIDADARERVAVPAYDAGSFGADDILVPREVTVRSAKRSATAIDSSEAQFGAAGYASADVLVTFSGSSVKAEKSATLGYAHVNGSWTGIGGESDTQLAWEALAGVDQKKVVANVDELLTRAEASFGAAAGAAGGSGADELTLADIYADADVEVVSESFDAEAQTDALSLRLTKAGSYEAYVCDLSVTFSFRPASGQWEISEISASKNAKTRVFDPLEGTWQGTFQSQETDGTKCLGAREGGLAVSITGNETADGTTRLTGTISGLAHYHEHPSSDADSFEGDARFEDVPFTATLVGGHNEATGSDLAFVATLPEEVGGTVTVTLGFGTAADPSRVVAVVQTTFPHTGSFLFIPFEETITYEDTFSLVRE